jgi:hypothetical protein
MRKIPYDKLQEIAEVVLPKILKRIIVDTNDGYVLYNQYFIFKKNNYINVLRRGDEREFQFFKLKHAIAWAILDNKFMMHEATKLHEIDNLLCGLDFEKKVHEKLSKKGTIEQYLIQTAKVQMITHKQLTFNNELDKYIKVAKLCQQKGFENEINRTKRK